MPLPPDLPLDNPLWQWATHLWQQPGVAAQCLKLQAEGWSVTRILTALWLAQAGQTWDGAEASEITEWRARTTDVIRQLRQQFIKEEQITATLRKGLMRCELQAEQLELALVWTHWQSLQQDHPDFCGVYKSRVWDNLLAAAPYNRPPGQDEHGALQSLCDCLYNEQMLIQTRTIPGDASC